MENAQVTQPSHNCVSSSMMSHNRFGTLSHVCTVCGDWWPVSAEDRHCFQAGIEYERGRIHEAITQQIGRLCSPRSTYHFTRLHTA